MAFGPDHPKHLESLSRKTGMIRDMVSAVARKTENGCYIYGPPGTSKSWTVSEILSHMDITPIVVKGHMAPMGLFGLIEKYKSGIFVFDDVTQIFSNKAARDILLSALGNTRGSTVRQVSYRRQGVTTVVDFTGGIIALSNMTVRDLAIASRTGPYYYHPTDNELAALMRDISSKGWTRKDNVKVAPVDTLEVTEFVIADSVERNRPLDMRPLYDWLLSHYIDWRAGIVNTHWKDYYRNRTANPSEDVAFTEPMGREATKQSEYVILSSIRKACESVAKQRRRAKMKELWTNQTGKSEPALYVRLREMKAIGL